MPRHRLEVQDTGNRLLAILQSIHPGTVHPANTGLPQELFRCLTVTVPPANPAWHPANPVSSVVAAKVEPAGGLVKADAADLGAMRDPKLPLKPLKWCLKFRMTRRSIRLSS